MIFFIGPLPPPLHGFSSINASMLAQLNLITDVKVFNRAPPLSSGYAGKLMKRLSICKSLVSFGYHLLKKKPASIYMGLSGGAGQLVDLAFLIISKLTATPVFIHHHSFAYLNKKCRIASLFFYFARREHHIVLCEQMGSRLAENYAIPVESITHLSNAAFSDGAESRQEEYTDRSLQIGFLSNITDAKGIFDYFDVLESLHKSGFHIQGRIAGPVDESIKNKFTQRLAQTSFICHLGAVYGQDKDAFYDSIDVLLFPTRYANEAEPVTIIESFRAGVPVIAASRGCIDALVAHGGGIVVPSDADFLSIAVKEISRLIVDKSYLTLCKHKANKRFEELRVSNRKRLANLLTCIVDGNSFTNS